MTGNGPRPSSPLAGLHEGSRKEPYAGVVRTVATLAAEPQQDDPVLLARKQQASKQSQPERSQYFQNSLNWRGLPRQALMTTRKGLIHWEQGWPWNGAPHTGPGDWTDAPEKKHQEPTPHSQERQQQPPLRVSLLPPGHSASEHHDKLQAPCLCSHGPSPEMALLHEVLLIHQTPEAAHDAPSGHQALPQGHGDPTEASSRLPQRRPLLG